MPDFVRFQSLNLFIDCDVKGVVCQVFTNWRFDSCFPILYAKSVPFFRFPPMVLTHTSAKIPELSTASV